MPLDPVIAAIVEKTRDAPALSDGTPEASRQLLAAGREALGAGPTMASVHDREIPGRGGAIMTRVFRPEAEVAGIITFFHGGGWVLGTIEDFDAFARTLAASSGCIVVLPDYRLAPEHPFPAGLTDAEDVLRWVADHRPELDGDGLPLIVAGDSAGGNLATIVARKVQDDVPLALQVLYYPVTDSDFSRASYNAHGEGLPLKARDMRWFFNHYAPSEKWTDPDISPLRGPVSDQMPPAVVVLAEYDVLKDEGQAYAEALRTAGLDVTLRECEGLTHGFIRLHNLVPAVQEELARIGREIRHACSQA